MPSMRVRNFKMKACFEEKKIYLFLLKSINSQLKCATLLYSFVSFEILILSAFQLQYSNHFQ